jgi:hypothetical protein
VLDLRRLREKVDELLAGFDPYFWFYLRHRSAYSQTLASSFACALGEARDITSLGYFASDRAPLPINQRWNTRSLVRARADAVSFGELARSKDAGPQATLCRLSAFSDIAEPITHGR